MSQLRIEATDTLHDIAEKFALTDPDGEAAVKQMKAWLLRKFGPLDELLLEIIHYGCQSLVHQARCRLTRRVSGAPELNIAPSKQTGWQEPNYQKATLAMCNSAQKLKAGLSMRMSSILDSFVGKKHLRDCTREELEQAEFDARQQGYGAMRRAIWFKMMIARLKPGEEVGKKFTAVQVQEMSDRAIPLAYQATGATCSGRPQELKPTGT